VTPAAIRVGDLDRCTLRRVVAQLRRSRIQQGRASQFAEEWRSGVAPLRREYGFRVQGWLVEASDEFVWLLEHDEDRAAFDAADAAYYASPQRAALRPDPARLIEDARQDWVTRVV
jgi:hypothetical protein